MLGEKIKALRAEKGLSQEELAARLAVVRQTVSKWEKGLSNPDSDMLVRIAEVLGVTVGELLSESADVYSPPKYFSAPTEQKRPSLKPFEIALLILGSPIWLSLLIAAFAVLLALYIVMWSVVISLWAVFACFAASAVAGIPAAVILVFEGEVLQGVALIGAALVLAGLAIFLFFGCKGATKGVLTLTKQAATAIKKRFTKKGAAE